MGATKTSYRDYVIANAVSLIKVILPVYIGSTFKSLLHEHLNHTDSVISIITGVVGIALGVGLAVYLAILVKTTITKNQSQEQPVDLPQHNAGIPGFLSIANQAIRNASHNTQNQTLDHVSIPMIAPTSLSKSQAHFTNGR